MRTYMRTCRGRLARESRGHLPSPNGPEPACGLRGQDARDTGKPVFIHVLRHSPRAAGAFTLLEMLVATAMVATLAGSLYASLHIAFKARSSALSATEAVRRNALAMEIIRADLQSAMVPGGVLATEFLGQSASAIAGGLGDSLVFYSTASDGPAGPGAGDISQIEYACQTGSASGPMELVRRVTTNLLAPTTPQPRAETLVRNVRSFRLRYYDGQAWQEAWDSAAQNDALPRAVEVTIEVEDAAERSAGPVSRVVLLPCGQGAADATASGEQP